MGTFFNDIKFAIRQLVKNPVFTIVAVASLTLGVTLNSAIFSLVDGLWLRSMPYADPERVVRIFGNMEGDSSGDLSYVDYLDLREQMDSLSGLATCARHGFILDRKDESIRLRHDSVSRSLFTVLGIKPHLGKFFSDADSMDLKNTQSAVLSYRAWQQYFNGDPNLVGQSIILSSRSLMVLAIAPPDFDSIERTNPAHVWTPVENHKINMERDDRYLSVIGRLKPGANIKQAQAEANAVFNRMKLRDASTHEPLQAEVLSEATFQRQQNGPLGIILMSIVGVILLLACANVASLLLARAEIRTREMAVRTAMGSSRWRLIRQLMAESLVLALITLAISILMVHWLVRAWPGLLPADSAKHVAQLSRLDGRVLGFTAVVSLMSIFLFGLIPALHASKPDLLPAIKGETGLGTSGKKRYRGLKLMVSGQTGIALVLVILATLLTRSLLAQFGTELGFEKKELLLVNISTGHEKHARQFHQQLKERVQALPGVKQVCLSRIVPFSPWGTGFQRKVFISNKTSASPQAGWSICCNIVDPGYFKLMGVPLLRGRTFLERDNKASVPVMVINETMAQKFWPDEDPVGQWIRFREPDGQAIQIIGVVRDTVLYSFREESSPYLFLPFAQQYHWENTLIVECHVKATSLVDSVRAELVALGEKPLQTDINTMTGYIRSRLSGEAFLSKMTGVFGLLGLALAAVGLYGVLAYMVNQHTHEIGIRMALGAQRYAVLIQFLMRGMSLVVFGAAIGVPIALCLGLLLRSALFGVSPMDPVSFILSLGVLLLVALLACYIPARRAAKIDPMEALRYE